MPARQGVLLGNALSHDCRSCHFLEAAWLKRGLFGPVDAEIGEPAFPGDGLDPLLLVPCGRRGAEVKLGWLIGVKAFVLEERSQRSVALIGDDLTARLQIVEADRFIFLENWSSSNAAGAGSGPSIPGA